jgi:hypothetical protein
MTRRRVVWGIMLAALLAGCAPTADPNAPLPTAITDLDALATAVMLTQNAPPLPYRERISLASFEDGLERLLGWHYTVSAEFSGLYAGTNRAVESLTTVEVTYNQQTSARRVKLRAEGQLLTQGEPIETEAVQIGQDVYVRSANGCIIATGTETAAVVSAGVGQLIGGVREAVPTGTRGVINGETVYRYAFLQDALILPALSVRDGGRISLLSQELWFSADKGALIRLYLTFALENVSIFGAALPVSGQIVLRYDLTDLGQPQNISIPYGC